MSELDVELAARNLVDQWAVRVAGWWPSQDQSEELARAMLALAESHPSDGLAALRERIAALKAPKPARRHFDMGWSAGFETARDVALAIVDAALTKADSAAPAEPVMSVAMSDADEGPA
jgi:hypothetical protein